MEPLRVWAPWAEHVEVDLPVAAVRVPLESSSDGWWQFRDEVPHGTDYAFRLDGGEPLPDPRSPWQPDGVHAHSRRFDSSRFDWSDDGWAGRDVRGAVLYELHVGTFTPAGTLDGAIDRLDHLLELGVQMVELMPLAAFPGVHGWGYDGVDLYAVHEPYGGPQALQRFVDAAHHRGMGVALDVVYNHLGPAGNYLGRFGPYFTDRHHTPWGAAVNLDGPEAEEVRAFIIDNALRWFAEFHIDALRLDAVHALVDDSPVHLLAELSLAVDDLSSRLGQPLGLIAESDLNDVNMVAPVRRGGMGMTAQWDDDVHHAIHATLTGERQGYYTDFGSLATLAKALTDVFVHDGSYSAFRDKVWGAPVPEEVSGHHFVISTTTHDQVGNRALGDRPAAALSAGRLAISAALLLTSHYTPMLFMGEEWGASTPWLYFTDHDDPDLAAAITAGRQREFGDHGWAQVYSAEEIEVPDPQDPATVEASRLDWAEIGSGPHARLLAFYRELIALRGRIPPILDGDRRNTRVRYDEAAHWIVLERAWVRIAINLGPAQQVPLVAVEPDIPDGEDDTAWQVLTSWDEIAAADVTTDGVTLPADSVAILAAAHQG